MVFVILIISLVALSFFTVPFYIDLYHAVRGEKTTFDGPEFIGWKIFAFVIPITLVVGCIWALFQ